jgi:hypothetical protein
VIQRDLADYQRSLASCPAPGQPQQRRRRPRPPSLTYQVALVQLNGGTPGYPFRPMHVTAVATFSDGITFIGRFSNAPAVMSREGLTWNFRRFGH